MFLGIVLKLFYSSARVYCDPLKLPAGPNCPLLLFFSLLLQGGDPSRERNYTLEVISLCLLR